MHRDHEIHTRRRVRNFGLLAVLLGFILLIFGLTIVKIQTGGFAEKFDHVARPAMVQDAEEGGASPEEASR